MHINLIKFGFHVSQLDPLLHLIQRNTSLVIILIVVDDISFTTDDGNILNTIKAQLSATYSIKLYGELKSFLK